MSTTLTISFEGMHWTDVERIRKQAVVSMRNVEIRARYADLRTGGMSQLDALTLLSTTYNLSESAINAILWPR